MVKRIFVVHRERSANRVFQYFFGLALQQNVPGSVIHGHDLDIFGVKDSSPLPAPSARHLDVRFEHDINLHRLAYMLNADLLDSVSVQGWAQRMEYLPAPEAARKLVGLDGDAPMLSADKLVIHIRGEDIFSNPHRDYQPLPLRYYEVLIADSGLRPVFAGQLDGDYGTALRRKFPAAEFRMAATPLADFKFLMQAPNIALSVSTFGWLAAWMSPAAKRILLPVAGLFNPAQRPDVDLIPHDDPRYEYYAFPVMKWRNTPAQYASVIDAPSPAQKISRADVEAAKRIAAQAVSLVADRRAALDRHKPAIGAGWRGRILPWGAKSGNSRA